MEVQLLLQNLLIVIHSSTCLRQWQLSFLLAGLVFRLKMPAELTMLTGHGLLSWEEDTLLHWMPCSEFHSRRVLHIYLRVVFQSGQVHMYSGQLSVPFTPGWRTKVSSCGFTKISATITLRLFLCHSHLGQHPSWPTHSTLLVQWLTCGLRKEVVTAHGTIAIASAPSGWSSTWTPSTSTF